METWLIFAAHSLMENIKKQPTKSYVKSILCILILYFKMDMLHDFCQKPEHAELTSILLRNLAIDSSSVFENEVKIFQNAYGQMFHLSFLNFINGAINSHPSLTEWIFAIPIVHFLTEQHNSLNSVDWNENQSNFKYVFFNYS